MDAAWASALDLAERLDDTDYRLRALWGRWIVRFTGGDFQTARCIALDFRDLAAKAAPADLPIGERMLGTTLHALGDLSLGRRHIERMLDRVTKNANDGYPPYNIEQITDAEGNTVTLRITLAVAGFTRERLDVSVENKQLTIRGRQDDNEHRTYLHRGIAARQFQRTFVLADGIEVRGADLKDGLLSIDLERPGGLTG